MKELKPRIHENGIDYILVGDYYVPDLKLPEEHRPIGHWGRLHQSYLKQFRPLIYNDLLLSGKLHTVLADLNERAADTLLTPDIVKTAHIPIQHNCTLLEGGARLFATDSVRLQAEIANVDLCGSLSTGVETPEGNWIEIMQYTGIRIQLQAKN